MRRPVILSLLLVALASAPAAGLGVADEYVGQGPGVGAITQVLALLAPAKVLACSGVAVVTLTHPTVNPAFLGQDRWDVVFTLVSDAGASPEAALWCSDPTWQLGLSGDPARGFSATFGTGDCDRGEVRIGPVGSATSFHYEKETCEGFVHVVDAVVAF